MEDKKLLCKADYDSAKAKGEERRKYFGPTGWILAHDDEIKVWKIASPMNENISITLNGKDILPVGKKRWKIPNSSCNDDLDEKRILYVLAHNQWLIHSNLEIKAREY